MGGATSIEESSKTELMATGAKSATETTVPMPSPPPSSPDRKDAEEDIVSSPNMGAGSFQARRSSATLLKKSLYGSHHKVVKGEDGLRVERVTIGGEQVVMAIVVDGHHGHEAAAHVVAGLVELVAEEAHGDAAGTALCSAAGRAFEELHRQLHNSPNPTNAGTTVTLCLLNEVRAELSVCNVGDSSAYLFAKPGSNGSKSPSIELTQSHRLETSESERARVRSMGGVVGQSMVGKTPVGPMRGYPGGVCCSRSLGDRDCGSWLSPVPSRQCTPSHRRKRCWWLPRMAFGIP